MLPSRLIQICVLLLFVAMLFPSGAHAYLDPGAGSYVFQLLLASLMGLLFVIGVYWKRVKGFFRRLLSREDAATRSEQTDLDDQES